MQKLASKLSKLSTNDADENESIITSTSLRSSSLFGMKKSSSVASLTEDELIQMIRETPTPEDPTAFIMAGFSPLFNQMEPDNIDDQKYHLPQTQEIPFELIRDYHVPKYFAEDFIFTYNTRSGYLDEFLNMSREYKHELFHEGLKSRYVETVIDGLLPQTLQKASVFNRVEVTIKPPDHIEEPVKCQLYSIVTVDNAKITHSHVIADQSPLGTRNREQNCCIQ